MMYGADSDGNTIPMEEVLYAYADVIYIDRADENYEKTIKIPMRKCEMTEVLKRFEEEENAQFQDIRYYSDNILAFCFVDYSSVNITMEQRIRVHWDILPEANMTTVKQVFNVSNDIWPSTARYDRVYDPYEY